MTPAVLTRCPACGRHREPDAFAPGSDSCLDCTARAAPTARPRRALGAKERAKDARARIPPSPELRALAATNAATWHECDGADVHLAHRAAHRTGFWTEGHRVVGFIEGWCVYPEGPLRGKPVVLMPFWREIILELYRLRLDGLRQYRRALIGLPKKSNKTCGIAWLALYHTVIDPEPSPRNVCAAANDDQADLVFMAAKTTCEEGAGARDATPGLSLATMTERWDREILVPLKPGASLRRLASGGGNLDGPNLYFRARDEVHEWTTAKNQTTYTVISQGGALRSQPLSVDITTAGWDRETIAYRAYEHALKVMQHPDLDPTLFAVWWEAPTVCSGEWAGKGPHEGAAGEAIDYRSEEGWRGANPAAGYTVSYERYLEDLSDPEMTEGVARRYRLNQWTDVQDVWLPRPWAAYTAKSAYTIDPARRTVAFIDASTRYDSTGIVWADAVPVDDGGWRVRVKSRAWERPTDDAGHPLEGWSVPFIEVRAHLYSMHFGAKAGEPWTAEDGTCGCGCGETFEPLGFEAVGYDPARITLMTEEWRAAGLPMVEVPSTDARMVPGFQSLFQLLKAERFQHDGDAMLARHVGNSAVRWAASGGQRLDRKQRTERRPNDLAVGLVGVAYLLDKGAEPVKPAPVPPMFFGRRSVLTEGDAR